MLGLVRICKYIFFITKRQIILHNNSGSGEIHLFDNFTNPYVDCFFILDKDTTGSGFS